MKGEWMRVLAGLADRAEATRGDRRGVDVTAKGPRIAPAPWRVYHDRTSDPDTLSVEAVGRGNLLALTQPRLRRAERARNPRSGGGRNAPDAAAAGSLRPGSSQRAHRRSRMGGRRLPTRL